MVRFFIGVLAVNLACLLVQAQPTLDFAPIPMEALKVDTTGEPVRGAPDFDCPNGAIFRGFDNSCGGWCRRCKNPFVCRRRLKNGLNVGRFRCLPRLNERRRLRRSTGSPIAVQRRLSACGEQCSEGKSCAATLQCRGKMCVSGNRGVGRPCAGKCQQCKTGLICLEGFCAVQPEALSPLPCGQVCNTLIPCPGNLKCDWVGAASYRKVCVATVGVGQVCSANCQRCSLGLSCEEGVCATRVN